MRPPKAEVVLINPNTNIDVTERMLASAHACSDGRMDLRGLTAEHGAMLIINETALAAAARAVGALAPQVRGRADGAIVAGFGDPGVDELRALLNIPVVGIGEAALKEAASGSRRFGVITTTPALVVSIDAKVAALGLAQHYGGVILTRGDAVEVTNSRPLLEEQLYHAAVRAEAMGIVAVAVGGGPLADAGRAIAGRIGIVLVDPIEAAVNRMIRELDATRFDRSVS